MNKETKIILGAATLLCSMVTHAKKNDRPNILFIMSDDHAYQAISAYGHGLNSTPAIDRLAKEGAIFSRCFVANSISSPSRATMLTGKFSHMNGQIYLNSKFDWNQPNVAKVLQQNGYETALIGKIHLDGNPQGFDYWNVLHDQGAYYNPDFTENGIKKKYSGYCTTITTELALDWLKNKRDTSKPFLLLYHQKAPHRTWMPEEKYLDLFEDKKFTPPSNFFDDYKGRRAAAAQSMSIDKNMTLDYDLKMLDDRSDLKSNLRKTAQELYDRMDSVQKAAWDKHYKPIIEGFKAQNLTGKELALWKYDRYMKDYLSTVQSVDDGVGEVLDYLDKNGLTENTIVIYTSDQGFYLGEHGWFDKRFMYEESFRTPFLIRYPKEIKSGSTVSQLVQNIDFAPTFLDYAGVKVPEDMQGESFRKVVAGKQVTWRDAVYYQYYDGGHSVKRHYGVRTDRYKLIHFYYDIDSWELFDLEKDPSEMHNVYNDPAYIKVKEMMHIKLEELRKKYKDSDELNQKYLKNRKKEK